MKKVAMFSLMAILAISCQKEPDMSKLDNDFMVYTNYDKDVNFNKFSTYYLPDSIAIPGSDMKAKYWTDENAKKIISNVEEEMSSRGYQRIKEKDKANLGLQLSYAEKTVRVQGYPYFGWGYNYWGAFWNGWYYPFPVAYSYNTGTVIIDLVNLTSTEKELPIIWHANMSGLLYSNSKMNMQLTLRAIEQAFTQSPIIKK